MAHRRTVPRQNVRHIVPEAYDPDAGQYARVPYWFVPILAGHIAKLEWSKQWVTEDALAGYQAAALMQERMVSDAVPVSGVWHLALGDSLALGVEASGNADTYDGYPDWLYKRLRAMYPGLAYHNEAVSGETSQTMIDDGQLQAALDFSAAVDTSGARVGLISIDIGGNDIAKIFPPPVGTAADGNTQIANFRTNFDHILTELRTAAPSALIATMNLYNPYPGFDFPLYGNLGDTWVPELNTAIADVAAMHNVPVSDTYSVIMGDEAHMARLLFVRRPYEVWDILNAETNFDFHLRPKGHQVVADEFFRTIMRQVFVRV